MTKKIVIKILAPLLLMLVAVIFGAALCVSAEVTEPFLESTTQTLYLNWESENIEPNGVLEDDVITYRVKNTSIAEVDSEGNISPLALGKTKVYIRVYRGEETYKFTVNVTVKEPWCKTAGGTEGMGIGQEFIFSITQHGYCEPVSWRLTGDQYASAEAVSPTDVRVTGLAPGTFTITGTSRDYSISYTVRVYDAKGTAFVVSAKSKPYNNRYTGYSSYNSKTKTYYMLQSYLERLHTLGGGILVLKKGTYYVTNSLTVPSNTTILLLDGARIVKSEDTGDPYLQSTRSLFQTVCYVHASKEGAFSGYDGEHDIVIMGEGNAVIDMNGIHCSAIVAAHCKRLTVKNLQFLNMNTGHFIELDASCDVEISGNYFGGYETSSTGRKEAINLDTPDKVTHGFTQNWTSYDATPNLRVSICDNIFENLEVAIGTHKYTEGKAHSEIEISRNTFINMETYAVRPMNWQGVTITYNLFSNRNLNSETETTAIIINGSQDFLITGNTIERYAVPISCAHWKNSGYGKSYAPIYNEFTEFELRVLQRNKAIDCGTDEILIYEVLGDYSYDSLTTYEMNQ